MKRIILLFINISLMYALSAQTIYHYKLVAKVNLNTEEKISASGKKLHVIYNSYEACLCDEYGKISEEESTKDEQKDVYSTHSREKVSGKQYHLQFQKTENGMSIYSAHYESSSSLWCDAMYGPFGMISPAMTLNSSSYIKNQYL